MPSGGWIVVMYNKSGIVTKGLVAFELICCKKESFVALAPPHPMLHSHIILVIIFTVVFFDFLDFVLFMFIIMCCQFYFNDSMLNSIVEYLHVHGNTNARKLRFRKK
jgi:hypothetical protein